VIRLATRASRLALWQARHVRRLLELQAAREGTAATVEIVEVSTIGDRDRQSRLAEMGGQGVFTREVQAAVLDARADIAVHSLKDLPTEPTAGLTLAGVPERGPRWDVLVAPAGAAWRSLDALPSGARVATGSLRRRAQLLHRRPDLQTCEVRGNVETRLRKLDAGEFDAILLAEAGLVRLELAERVTCRCDPEWMLPAVGQAALGLECRAGDDVAQRLLCGITAPRALTEALAERSCLATLRAGCHAPVGVLSSWPDYGAVLKLDGAVLSPDGRERLAATVEALSDNPAAAGQALAQALLERGGDRLLARRSPDDFAAADAAKADDAAAAEGSEDRAEA